MRGARESNLYDNISGKDMRRNLYDDIKKRQRKVACEREKEELERCLVNAKIACDAEEDGRRSGRLASLAQVC